MDSKLLSEAWEGSYRLIREVGRGGMGVVWEAWDERLERRVAVKMLHPYLFTDKAVGERLLQEARIAARIEHPNVVRVYRVEMVDGRLAIEMQYIEGGALPQVLTMGVLPGPQAADLLGQILAALVACHAQSVIHCDLKPGNLLVSLEGQVFLTDFGIAHALSSSEVALAATPATSGPLWGTPQYTPPEAWQGEPPTPLWDIYAAGLILYEVLSGEPPFQGRTPLAVMLEKHANPLPSISQLRGDLTPEFASLIDDMISPDARARPVSAQAAVERLRATEEYRNRDSNTEPIRLPPRVPQPEPQSEPLVTPPAPQRRWWLAALASVIILAATLLVGYTGGRWNFVNRVESVAPNIAKSDGKIMNLWAMPNRAVFSYDDGEHGRELWCVNAEGDPWLAQDINPGPESSNPRNLQAHGINTVLFAATTREHGEELWRCNTGMPDASATLVRDILPGPMGSEPNLLASNEALALLYATTLQEGRELWATNSTPAQTAIVQDLVPGPSASQPMGPSIVRDGNLAYLVSHTHAAFGLGIIRYDFVDNAIDVLTPIDGQWVMRVGTLLLYDHVGGADQGRELWFYNEETGEAGMVVDLYPGSGSSNPREFFRWKGKLYFQADSPQSERELWVTDGTASGTRMVADIQPGISGSDPFSFVDAGDSFYFKATTALYGEELYRGDEAGVSMVHDLRPGVPSATPYNMTVNSGWLLFSANDGKTGEELWMLDTRQPGAKPRQVADIVPGPESSAPHGMKWSADGLGYFVVTDERGLQQLYRINLADDGWGVTHLHLPEPVGWSAP